MNENKIKKLDLENDVPIKLVNSEENTTAKILFPLIVFLEQVEINCITQFDGKVVSVLRKYFDEYIEIFKKDKDKPFAEIVSILKQQVPLREIQNVYVNWSPFRID